LKEVLTLPEHLSLPMIFSGVRVTRSFYFSMFYRSLFVLFLLAIMLSILFPTILWLPDLMVTSMRTGIMNWSWKPSAMGMCLGTPFEVDIGVGTYVIIITDVRLVVRKPSRSLTSKWPHDCMLLIISLCNCYYTCMQEAWHCSNTLN